MTICLIGKNLTTLVLSKILINKFELGLFDNPYVDEDIINKRVNTTENIEAGIEA